MKRILTFVLVVLVVTSSTFSVHAAPSVTSLGACVMDYDTGEVLYQLNGNTSRVPASMTKVMAVYCIYDAISNGEIGFDTKVPISSRVYSISRNSLYQNMIPLNYNEVYTVDEMLDVIIAHSASAATIAVAELVGGSEWNFVKRMNKKASDLGINAWFIDCCGVENNTITPISMAKLACSIIKDYPDILERSSKPSVYFHGRTYKTTNHLLDTFYYEGADGLKTGTSSVAGNCFCGTAVRNDKRLVSVTMGSSSANQRFIDTQRLLDYGFSVADYTKTSIYFTDISTFINGYEVPTFVYLGGPSYAVVIAEDLASYGFDVNFVQEESTLYISYNGNTPITPKGMDYYKNKNGVRAFGINQANTVKVVLKDAGCELANVYNINGYMCVAIDDLAKAYSYTWDYDFKQASITTN